MNWMTEKAVAAQIALTGYVAGAFERMKTDERGQGAVEYVGVIILVVAVIAIVLLAKTEIGNGIKNTITGQITKLQGLGG